PRWPPARARGGRQRGGNRLLTPDPHRSGARPSARRPATVQSTSSQQVEREKLRVSGLARPLLSNTRAGPAATVHESPPPQRFHPLRGRFCPLTPSPPPRHAPPIAATIARWAPTPIRNATGQQNATRC